MVKIKNVDRKKHTEKIEAYLTPAAFHTLAALRDIKQASNSKLINELILKEFENMSEDERQMRLFEK